MTDQPERRRNTPTQMYLRVAAVVALPFALIALIPSMYAVWRVWEFAQENRQATCSFVNDLQDRYDSTARYIQALERRDFPPIPGAPTIAELKMTNNNRKATLDSFAELDCGGEGT